MTDSTEESTGGDPRLVVAQCTSEKRDEKAVAADLYDESNYFRAQRAYARTADKWAIQSAKHGLLWPHEEVHPYNKTPDDIDDVEYTVEGPDGEQYIDYRIVWYGDVSLEEARRRYERATKNDEEDIRKMRARERSVRV
jgi:hypothetical protein